jgi:UCH-binding domain
MYSDIFEQFSNAARRGGPGSPPTANSGSGPQEPSAVVSFWAGKIDLTWQEDIQSFHCEPSPTRGEVRLVWKTAASGGTADSSTAPAASYLEWQWFDRKKSSIVDRYPIPIPSESIPATTFERVQLPLGKKHANDRVYVWNCSTPASPEESPANGLYRMYWMQKKHDEETKVEATADDDEEMPDKKVTFEHPDDEIVAKVNQYLADPESARPPSDTSTVAAAPTGTTAAQVDALSSILENLGMPQGSETAAATTTAATTTDSAAPAAATNTLTLADLQGAMASIQQQQQEAVAAASGPNLPDVVTPAAINELLQNAEVRQRLIALLPENQRTDEQLNDNVRSPQVQQTLRALTQILLPDEQDDDDAVLAARGDDDNPLDGLYTLLANFQLDPADGQVALATTGNPIQAFLDCILASVSKKAADEAAEQPMAVDEPVAADAGMEETTPMDEGGQEEEKEAHPKDEEKE